MESAPARQLEHYGFEGWDVSQGNYLTDYLVLVVSVGLAFASYDSVRGTVIGLWGMLGNFVLFALIQGLGAGLAGITHHLLSTYYEQGTTMGRHWGDPRSEWIATWLLSVICLPLASSWLLGVALAYTEIAVNYLKASLGIGIAFSLWEFYLVYVQQVEKSGTYSAYWAILAGVIGAVVIYMRGGKKAGLWYIFSGCLCRSVGFALVVFVPMTCGSDGDTKSGCPFSQDFNHNCIFHILLVASVVCCYRGVMDKFNKDKELSYNAIMRVKPDTRMCGCSC
mmetsp:Transcript_54369/g.116103  ORF Transcript_54369/g.116103 Transcript_54369/m.116103 type:complete len:280 (+) Transcript_54369:227-1066(+)